MNDIGYCIHEDHWRRGYASEALALVLEWLKARGAIRLELHTWGFNTSAIAMYETMGMTPQRYVFEKQLKGEGVAGGV